MYTIFIIGLFLFSIYREGKRPYSYMCHILSGRIRTWRHTNKYKIKSQSTDEMEKESGLDRQKEMLQEKGTLRELLEDADYTRMMRECRKECTKSSPDKIHVKKLLKKTFPNRRQEISRMNKEGMPMMSSVILDWSCFEYGEYVSILIYMYMYK